MPFLKITNTEDSLKYMFSPELNCDITNDDCFVIIFNNSDISTDFSNRDDDYYLTADPINIILKGNVTKYKRNIIANASEKLANYIDLKIEKGDFIINNSKNN